MSVDAGITPLISAAIGLIWIHLVFFCYAPAFAFSVERRHNSPFETTDERLPMIRDLPEKILVGYATHCSEKVAEAVRGGVNVVIWAFVYMKEEEFSNETETRSNNASRSRAKCTSSFDLLCAKDMIAQLDAEGYSDTVHLVSFGGWNGPHLPDDLDVLDMYGAWKDLVGETFHGVDWDLEGHDRLDYATNEFSIACLDNMGKFSEMAKHDGYIVGMAPPQSYLDIEDSRFSRLVNLTDPTRQWHDDFHYFGHNVYAYLLSKYGDSIDFVSVQFYESYARAGLEVFHRNIPPATYLQSYVQDLISNREESFFVDFEQDPVLEYSSRRVHFPLSKLVFGFANGWGATDNEKVCYFDPNSIAIAYSNLVKTNQTPRGFMFWVIDEEGSKDIHFSRSLGNILKTRNKSSTVSLYDINDVSDL